MKRLTILLAGAVLLTTSAVQGQETPSHDPAYNPRSISSDPLKQFLEALEEWQKAGRPVQESQAQQDKNPGSPFRSGDQGLQDAASISNAMSGEPKYRSYGEGTSAGPSNSRSGPSTSDTKRAAYPASGVSDEDFFQQLRDGAGETQEGSLVQWSQGKDGLASPVRRPVAAPSPRYVVWQELADGTIDLQSVREYTSFGEAKRAWEYLDRQGIASAARPYWREFDSPESADRFRGTLQSEERRRRAELADRVREEQARSQAEAEEARRKVQEARRKAEEEEAERRSQAESLARLKREIEVERQREKMRQEIELKLQLEELRRNLARLGERLRDETPPAFQVGDDVEVKLPSGTGIGQVERVRSDGQFYVRYRKKVAYRSILDEEEDFKVYTGWFSASQLRKLTSSDFILRVR